MPDYEMEPNNVDDLVDARSRVSSKDSQHSMPKRRDKTFSNFDDNAAVGDYDMKKSASTAAFVHEMIEDRFITKARQRLVPRLRGLQEERKGGVAAALLGSATEALLEGVDALGEDDFWKCFEKRKVENWNWNPLLFFMWMIGCTIRYLILFPARLAFLLVGWMFFFGGMLFIQAIPKFMLTKKTRSRGEQYMISAMSSCFVLTWSGVIRYHGRIPKASSKSTNYVFVANHTSLIDVIILQQVKCFSLVGQKHKGVVGFLQDRVLNSLECIWFDRGEMRDRTVVSKKLSEHAKDPNKNALLVFPEGTCVNNDHVIQFKKGVFELGVPIVPIVIKYNKMFVDPFWSSRDQSFLMHLVELMTSWCMICDVWFIEPTVRRDGESAEDFAARVRNSIAEKGGMKAVDWDGYLKHFQASERLLNQRKAVYEDAFKKILDDLIDAKLNQIDDVDANDGYPSGGMNGIHYSANDEDFYIEALSPTISVTSDSAFENHAPAVSHHMRATGSSVASTGSGRFMVPSMGPAALTTRLKNF